MPIDHLSTVFAALADPTRRAILARLAQGEATVNQLAEPFEMSLPGVSKHLKVLQRAGLVEQGRQAQWRPCRLQAEPLREVAGWVGRYRRFYDERFERLDDSRTDHGAGLPRTEATVDREGEPIMAVQQLGNETTTVYTEDSDLRWERVFDAPRELVWKAHTEPERLARWWGPRRYTTEVVEMDVRPGGTWRFINRAADGGEHPFTGEYLEVVPPEKLVWTFTYDVEPMNQEQAGVETFLFEDLGGGKTKLSVRSRFPSVEALQGALATGMVEGGIETYDRLAEELARG